MSAETNSLLSLVSDKNCPNHHKHAEDQENERSSLNSIESLDPNIIEEYYLQSSGDMESHGQHVHVHSHNDHNDSMTSPLRERSTQEMIAYAYNRMRFPNRTPDRFIQKGQGLQGRKQNRRNNDFKDNKYQNDYSNSNYNYLLSKSETNLYSKSSKLIDKTGLSLKNSDADICNVGEFEKNRLKRANIARSRMSLRYKNENKNGISA